jgi:fatty-acyl-CoA synthase
VAYSLWTLFDAVAGALPDREAIVWRDQRLRYSELHERARRLAALFEARGLGRHTPRSELADWETGQDLVGLYLLNGPEYLEGSLGAYAAAVAPFNVNYRYVADELAYLLDDAGTSGLVYHARFAPLLAEVLPRLRRRPSLLLQVADDSHQPLLDGAEDYETALAATQPMAAPESQADDLYVLYTGGTTGMPKGTLWRQADIWAAAIGSDLADADLGAVVAAAEAAAALGRGRFLPNAPMMHGAAHWVAMRMLLTGGCVVINDVVDRLDPADAWQVIQRERCDSMLVVGESMARPLIAELERGDYDASSLALVLAGGAVTSPETKERLVAQLPQVMVLDVAGASETGGSLSSLSAKDATAEAGLFNATPAAAVLDAGRTRLLDPGDDEIGWFAKRTHLPLGYLGDETKTGATFPYVAGERWSVPGDRARWHRDGRIELLGRDSVTINTGGEKVFAEEVEAALLIHPAVIDAVVVGRPSERWGSEVVAVLALNDPSVSDDDLAATAAQRIARYKLPKAIVRVPLVVRSPAGKADYRWARQVALGEIVP